ncbi:MAG: hypothetical protein ACOWWR_16190 [Eubacteriales bacterium]
MIEILKEHGIQVVQRYEQVRFTTSTDWIIDNLNFIKNYANGIWADGEWSTRVNKKRILTL